MFLLRELNEESMLWDVLVDPARKIRIGNKLYFGENDELVAEVIDNTTSRGRTLRFLFDGTKAEFLKKIAELGEIPLPRYLDRGTEDIDSEDSKLSTEIEGAVGAPAAGLHFSKQILKRLEIKRLDIVSLLYTLGLELSVKL